MTYQDHITANSVQPLISAADQTRIKLAQPVAQNTKVILDVFGGNISEESAAQAMHKHRRAETKMQRAKHRLAYDNSTSADGRALAEKAAKELRLYWAERGYAVSTIIEHAGFDGAGKAIWRVKSDLKNGLPRGFRQ